MSSPPQAVAGTFAEFRQVKTRGVLQIVVEVPIERAKGVLDLLGFPQLGEEQWVAVAPLAWNPYAPREGLPAPQVPTSDGRREMPLGDAEGTKLVTAAVMKCKDDIGFQNWLMARHGPARPNGWPEDDVKNELCARLGIESRRQIGTQAGPRSRWLALVETFYQDTRYGPPGYRP